MEHKQTSNLRRNIVIGVAGLVIIAVLIICLAPVMSEGYSVSVTEPVQTQQPYTVTVTTPNETQQPLTYQVTNTSASHDLGLGTGGCAGHAYVTVENTDTEAGTFTVNYTFSTTETVAHDTQSVYVLPGEWQTAEGTWQSLGCFATFNWSYTVQPPMKTMTTYYTSEETLYRTVTDYQTHNETRYRKVSLTHYWIQ